MQMMEQAGQNPAQSPGGFQQHFNNQTLEINPANSIIVNLNHLRKTDPKLASVLTKQLLDNVMLVSGVPFDTQRATERSYTLIEKVLDAHLSSEERPRRKLKEESAQGQEATSPLTEDGESILKKASRDIKNEVGGGRKMVKDYKVSEKDFKK